MPLSSEDIEARTPADRYRYADALRLGSLLVVVLGHWLLIVFMRRDGDLDGASILVLEPWTQWATWVAQVMPVFFFVGGYANHRSLARALERGTAPADWIRARARRLLRPVLPLVATWMLAVAVMSQLGVPPRLLTLGSTNAIIPAWFLAVYLAILAMAPLTIRLHARFGWRALLVGAVVALVCDLLARAAFEEVGWLNFLVVWGIIHQAGYLWGEKRLPRRPLPAIALVAGGLAALVAMTQFAGYPITMVDFDQYGRSNSVPPSAALLALGVAQLGIIQLARGPAERMLGRPAVWAALTRAGAVIMTIFLWHMTAALAAGVGVYGTGLLDPATERGVDAAWWAWRPVWLMACALVGALILPIMVWFERTGPAPSRPSVPLVSAGVLAAGGGLSWLLMGSMYDPDGPAHLPVVPLVLFLAGLAALGVLSRSPRTSASAP